MDILEDLSKCKIHSYLVEHELGRGKSGIVHLVMDNQNKKKYVRKQIKNVNHFHWKENPHQITSDNFTNQVLIHLILNRILKNQPNYLRQYDYYLEEGSGYTITEYANLGDLSEYLSKIENLSDRWIQEIFRQVCKPLVALKKYSFLHSDLKTKNILVHQTKKKEIIYKIADFDKSSIIYQEYKFFNDTYNYTLGNYKTPPFTIHQSKLGYEYYTLSDVDLYGRIVGFHEYIMSNPYGFYLSFDYYTFFYSFLLEKPVLNWMLEHLESTVWNYYHYLFHLEEEEEWNKFMNHLRDIYSGKLKGNTSSIVFYWHQFKTYGFKLRLDVSKMIEWLDILIE